MAYFYVIKVHEQEVMSVVSLKALNVFYIKRHPAYFDRCKLFVYGA